LVAGSLQKQLYRNTIRVPKRKELYCFGWGDDIATKRHVARWAWMSDRLNHVKSIYGDCVEADPMVRGGVPVIRGTRVPVSLLFANIASDMTVTEVADDLDLDVGKVRAIVKCIAIAFDRPQHEYDPARRMHEFEETTEGLCYGEQDSDTGVSEGT